MATYGDLRRPTETYILLDGFDALSLFARSTQERRLLTAMHPGFSIECSQKKVPNPELLGPPLCPARHCLTTTSPISEELSGYGSKRGLIPLFDTLVRFARTEGANRTFYF
jgi:hypothetical protein